jgi:chlorite dismutase
MRVSMIAGASGDFRIDRIAAIRGDPLPAAGFLSRIEGAEPAASAATWVLRGVRSHERYTTRSEKERLTAASPDLGRPGMDAALIPIRKSAAWWSLAQDERRALFEERSRHIGIGLEYLPAVARRLYHSRDLGEPFDFLTWFEFAPADAARFDELLGRLRETEEWRYVEREVEVRLTPSAALPRRG